MNDAAMNVVGIDIGGANLKFATPNQTAWSCLFPMWKTPQQLSAALQHQLSSVPRIDALAVTMTGELADCFVDRAEGVRHIVHQTSAAADALDIQQVAFYGVDGRFRTATHAIRNVDLVAAANWHGLGSYVARNIAADGLLIDIGSTTSDLIPLAAGKVATAAQTDFDRLREGSLVYVGCRRTPICALLDYFMFRGDKIPLMNEVFATIDDACLLLGLTAPARGDCDTADGKPRTIDAAANRIARMIGLDRRNIHVDESRALANQVLQAARHRIHTAVEKLPCSETWILSGHGDGLLSDDRLSVPRRNVIQLADHMNREAVRCAPSLAVASLFLEHSGAIHGRCDV